MEKKTLAAVKRDRLGSSEARRLRRMGKIPAVVYGHTGPLGVAVDAHEFQTKFHTVSESTLIQLDFDGTNHEVLIRDYQHDIVRDCITHIDFYEVERGKLLRTNVALQLKGAAAGVREGGLLESFVHEVEVECLPQSLVDRIEVDISPLGIGHSIHIRDLVAPEGVRLLASPDQVVCTIVHKRVEVEEKPAEVVEEGAVAEEGVVEESTEE
jgi:large subunit ribosomal protein L25